MKIIYDRNEQTEEKTIPKVVEIISSAPVLERILAKKISAEKDSNT